MGKTSINIELQEQIEARLISGVAKMVIAVFGILVIATAAIPAILAYLYSWKWLALYPCTFAICTLFAGRKKH